MKNIYVIFGVALLFGLVNFTYSLECYVCEQQDNNNNNGKCKSTVITCNYTQDRCMSLVGWGSTPFWEIGAPMQYYISKMCADKEMCEKKHAETIRLCERIEWRDWQCSECCQGDRCNYFITLAGTSVRSSLLILCASTFITFILFYI